MIDAPNGMPSDLKKITKSLIVGRKSNQTNKGNNIDNHRSTISAAWIYCKEEESLITLQSWPILRWGAFISKIFILKVTMYSYRQMTMSFILTAKLWSTCINDIETWIFNMDWHHFWMFFYVIGHQIELYQNLIQVLIWFILTITLWLTSKWFILT